jgi:hypothetical protein|tara:strand:+ start:6558 stop:7397 length:840 start_codon:yes stop_codon:yes gene_type:complete
MSTSISTAFIAQFDAEVKQAYQGAAKLFGTVRTKTGVNGSTHRFPKLGKGLAQPRIPQTDVVPMNVQHSNATATLEDWSAPEYSDIYDLQKINFDERKELKMAIASAMGRRMDQLLLDAADAGASATQVSDNIGGTDSGLNTTKLRRAKRLMDAAGVPATDRVFVHGAIGLEQLLGETNATSSDFNSIKALVNGEIDTWLGFKFVMIEDRDEGGLDLTSNIRKNFAYHKQALGLAIGIDMRTEINYISEKTSWLVNGIFSAGSVGIDSAGIIEVLTFEA